jgi:hypothetical protein
LVLIHSQELLCIYLILTYFTSWFEIYEEKEACYVSFEYFHPMGKFKEVALLIENICNFQTICEVYMLFILNKYCTVNTT